MTLTVDLLTPKSKGHILDSWGVSVWSFMIIGWLQSQLSSGNHFQITMRHDLDLWPFDLKINRAHPWLMVSKCMKFHDHRLITESVIVRKPFSNNHAPWPWPFDLKINRAHPWLMVGKCMKFHVHWLITESVIVRKPFSNNHAPWPWPLTSKSKGHILDSWGVSVWSFKIIGWLQSQLSSGNHFQITIRHDLDLWPFDLKINRAHPWLMVSKCMKFHDHRLIIESVIVRKPFSNNHAPWPWPLTFWPQNR